MKPPLPVGCLASGKKVATGTGQVHHTNDKASLSAAMVFSKPQIDVDEIFLFLTHCSHGGSPENMGAKLLLKASSCSNEVY